MPSDMDVEIAELNHDGPSAVGVDTPSSSSPPAAANGGGAGGGGGKPNFVANLEAADSGFKKYINKANLSNLFTFVVMVIGLVLVIAVEDTLWTRYILSFGLFGFAGGVTNWLAITMLFDEIPFVIGSGIIPKQFEEIKRTIANMIMDTFFEPAFLRRQLSTRTKELGNRDEVKRMINEMLQSDAFDKLLDDKLDAMQEGKGLGGTLMKTFNIQGQSLKPTIKKFVTSLASEFSALFLKVFDPATFFDDNAVLKLRGQLEIIIEDRLRELTADKVKALMEIVIRVHLGWLVVWGNVFGGVIGVISTAAGY